MRAKIDVLVSRFVSVAKESPTLVVLTLHKRDGDDALHSTACFCFQTASVWWWWWVAPKAPNGRVSGF